METSITNAMQRLEALLERSFLKQKPDHHAGIDFKVIKEEALRLSQENRALRFENQELKRTQGNLK